MAKRPKGIHFYDKYNCKYFELTYYPSCWFCLVFWHGLRSLYFNRSRNLLPMPPNFSTMCCKYVELNLVEWAPMEAFSVSLPYGVLKWQVALHKLRLDLEWVGGDREVYRRQWDQNLDSHWKDRYKMLIEVMVFVRFRFFCKPFASLWWCMVRIILVLRTVLNK